MTNTDENIGSKWDFLLSIFDKNPNIFRTDQLLNQNEIKTVQFLLKEPIINDTLCKWLESLKYPERLQNEEATKNLRNKGNVIYNSSPMEAIIIYTQAIYAATKNSSELGLAHANRAAALMANNYFEEAYYDCEMALLNDYPKENVKKILFRQAKCALEIKNLEFLQNVLEKIIVNNYENTIQEENLLTKLNEEIKNISTIPEKVVHIESSKNVIKEKYSKEQGRYFVADKNIVEGDLILNEKAFALVMVYNKYNNIDYDCHCCAKTNIIPFPCYKCSRVSYCSPTCCDKHKPIHQYECMGYKLNLWFEIGIAHLSIRTFLTGYLSLFQLMPPIVEEFCTPTSVWNNLFSENKLNKKDKYSEVLNLVTNFDKMDKKDFLQYSLTSVMLTNHLKNCTTFFDDLPFSWLNIMPNKCDWEIFVAGLILRHIGQLVCNGHAIIDYRQTNPLQLNCLKKKNVVCIGMLHKFLKSTKIFTGIFPKISLMNHSCNSNILNSFNKNALTIYAKQDIHKNKEIFNCYGPCYQLMVKSERQILLKQQYSFTCNCEKCISNDEIMFDYFICMHCKKNIYVTENQMHKFQEDYYIKCKHCKNNNDFNWIKECYALLETNSIEVLEGMEFICRKVCYLYEEYSKMLSPSHLIRKEVILLCLKKFLNIFGPVNLKINFNEKLTNMSIDLMYLEEIKFGICSTEYMNALLYYLDLLAYAGIRTSQPFSSNETKVMKSIDLLSNTTKIIVENYIKNYITCLTS